MYQCNVTSWNEMPDHQGECYCIDCQKWKQANEGFLLDNYDEDNVYTGKVWVCFECIENG